jgi:hypothetical protein
MLNTVTAALTKYILNKCECSEYTRFILTLLFFFPFRTNLHEQFLENQILEAIKLWLEPLPDGSLPSLDIQNDMLDILAKVSDTAL